MQFGVIVFCLFHLWFDNLYTEYSYVIQLQELMISEFGFGVFWLLHQKDGD